MKSVQAGLSLIELSLLIAVIGVLAAVALPAYEDHIIREYVAEAISATSQCRTIIAEIYASAPRGATIGSNNWRCAERLTATRYLASLSTDPDGVITVTMSTNISLGAAESTTLTLTPAKEDGTALSIRDIPAKVFSFKCKAGGATPIDEKYLPISCRE